LQSDNKVCETLRSNICEPVEYEGTNEATRQEKSSRLKTSLEMIMDQNTNPTNINSFDNTAERGVYLDNSKDGAMPE